MPQISTAFDGGNIKVLDQSDPGNIRLEIQKDGQADFYQWFYFRVSEIGGAPLRLVIENAGGSSYPKGWSDYRAVASTDRKTWMRVDSSFDGKGRQAAEEEELYEAPHDEIDDVAVCMAVTKLKRDLRGMKHADDTRRHSKKAVEKKIPQYEDDLYSGKKTI